jgi:mRNA interferase MazF
MHKKLLPTHVWIDSSRHSLVKDSVVLAEQIRTIDKKRLREKICRLDEELMKRVDHAIYVSLGLGCLHNPRLEQRGSETARFLAAGLFGE